MGENNGHGRETSKKTSGRSKKENKNKYKNWVAVVPGAGSGQTPHTLDQMDLDREEGSGVLLVSNV